MNQRTYKIRSFSNGKNRQGEAFVNYSLTIPSHIAEKLPKGMQFYCELTDAGLLFRPVPPDQEQVALPEWATANGGDPEKPKRTPRKKPTSKPRSKPTSASKPKTTRRRPQAVEAAPDTEAEAASLESAESQPEAAAV